MKLVNWDKRLFDYIETVQDEPFEWGYHDCLTFANTCVQMQIGSGFCDEYLHRYDSAKNALVEYRKFNTRSEYKDFLDAVDSRLTRIYTEYPPRGTIVGRDMGEDKVVLPIAFGVVVSDLAAFVGNKGLVFLPTEKPDIFWSVT